MSGEPHIARADNGLLKLHWPEGLHSTPVARELMEQIVERHNTAVYMRHALADIVEYVERDHRITIPAHDHDCYELWSVEKEHALRLVAEWDGLA